MKHFIFLLVCLFFGITFQDCKKDSNPVEPQPPVAPLSKSISVVIQEPSSDGSYVTLKEKVTLTGMVVSENPLKEVKWKSSSGEGTASGLENWTIAEVPLKEGDNLISVSAADNSSQMNSDTIVITKNKYLNFLSLPQFSPQSIPSDQTTNVIAKIEIEPVANLDQSSVKLVQLDENNNVISEVSNLYDDGSLYHGDDIKGDNVFSNIVQFIGSKTGARKYRVIAQTQESAGMIEGKSSIGMLNFYDPGKDVDLEDQKKVQSTAADKIYESFNQSKDIQASVNSAVSWLKTQANVKSAEAFGDRVINIEYTSGEKGSVIVNEVDENGKSLYLGGGGIPDTLNRQSQPLKLKHQTRGTYEPFSIRSIAESDTNLILNKKVLIWSPFEDELLIDVITSIKEELNKSTLGLKITHLTGLDATVEAARSFPDYGLVIIFTHGYGGMEMLTKEEVTPAREFLYRDLRDKYQPQILINTQVTVCRFLLIPLVKWNVYSILPRFILNLKNKFPKSVILNISCESARVLSANPAVNLALAFIKKGASNYFGYTGLTNAPFAYSTAPEFIKQLAVYEKTTHEAYKVQETNVPFNNKFRMFSAYPVKYTSSLLNGDYEFGKLAGWEVSGDGRIITGLGPIKPYRGKYMGIISTGLGFTTSSGEFTQTFRIQNFHSTLSLYWNFLSEELLEYIGSGYQDVFKITLKGENGSETVLLEKNIDQIAAQFGATKESGGSLQYVSPDIKFDRGDVYGTGWVSASFDVSQFRGQTVTLSISVGDVGDSSYDTAVLLDDISLD